MPGGITQLIGRGIEDRKLTYRPRITYFLAHYDPYVQFSAVSVENQFAGSVGFGETCVAKISRTGDLMNNMIMEIVLGPLSISGASSTTLNTTFRPAGFTLSGPPASMSVRVLYKGSGGIISVGVATTGFGTLVAGDFTSVVAPHAENAGGGVGTGAADYLSAAVRAALLSAAGIVSVAADVTVSQGPSGTWIFAYGGNLAGLPISFEIISTTGMGGAYFSVALGASAANTIAWVENPGHAIIEWIALEIGGQEIDRQYGIWFDIWNQLLLDRDYARGYLDMIGQQYFKTQEYISGGATGTNPVALYLSGLQTYAPSHPSYKLYIPLRFWFNEHPGLALPLLALNQQQICLRVKFINLADRPMYRTLGTGGTITAAPQILSGTVWADYILLDPRERSWYLRSSIEYLITQVQNSTEGTNSDRKKFKITFNNPVKELMWVIIEDAATTAGYWNRYATYDGVTAVNGYLPAGAQSITSAALFVGGNKITDYRDAAYYSRLQPWFRHTRVPESYGIYVFSFALDPEEFQPTGTLNMSRTDYVELDILRTNAVQAKCHIFGISLNFLEIDRGLGGISFSG